MPDHGCFMFNGKILTYMQSRYNNATNNERSIEVPIAFRLYNHVLSKQHGGKKILEVGAVLPHYHPHWIWENSEERSGRTSKVFPHLCIDKYEKYPGVINRDILDWNPVGNTKFDLILSISTMEHIFDHAEGILGNDKIKRWTEQIITMRSWLNRDGLMMFTIPYDQPAQIGGGHWIDLLLEYLSNPNDAQKILHMEDDLWMPDRILKMTRMGFGIAGNKWREPDVFDGPSLTYDPRVPSAGTVFFLFWGNLDKFWD